VSKFDLADKVTLSRPVVRVIRSMDRMETDAARTRVKDDALTMGGDA
jgi:hypothetical protein